MSEATLFYYPIFLSHINAIVFSPLHEKAFETDKKIYCGIDELFILF